MGLTNHKFFLLFLLYGTLLAGYGLVLILWRFLGCDASPCFGTAPGAGTMVSFTVGIAVLLGMFTCCMLSEQIRAVMDNVTGACARARTHVPHWGPVQGRSRASARSP